MHITAKGNFLEMQKWLNIQKSTQWATLAEGSTRGPHDSEKAFEKIKWPFAIKKKKTCRREHS